MSKVSDQSSNKIPSGWIVVQIFISDPEWRDEQCLLKQGVPGESPLGQFFEDEYTGEVWVVEAFAVMPQPSMTLYVAEESLMVLDVTLLGVSAEGLADRVVAYVYCEIKQKSNQCSVTKDYMKQLNRTLVDQELNTLIATPPPISDAAFKKELHPICQCDQYQELGELESLDVWDLILAPPTIQLTNQEWSDIVLLMFYSNKHGTEGRRVMLSKVLSGQESKRLTESGYTLQDVAQSSIPNSRWHECFPEWNKKLGMNWWES
jgi:hypothetical protein